MSVANITTNERSNGRSIKSWTNLTPEQKNALDQLAKDNHMSTSEYHRVVLSFAIANRWGFFTSGSDEFDPDEFQRLVASHPARVPRKYALTRGSIDDTQHIGMGPIPK